MNQELKMHAERFHEKLQKIKIFACDVDGVLTNGHIWWASEEVGFNRTFHAHDGYGMKILQEAGLKVGFISGGNSVGLVKRIDYLALDFSYIGNEDKRGAWEHLLARFHCVPEEVLFIGDDFIDLPILKRAGFTACPPESSWEIQEQVDYVTVRAGGNGCVREVVDLVRFSQGIVPHVASY